MSANLLGVVSQNLVKRMDGQGRIAVFEILVAIPAVRNLIREGKTHQIAGLIQVGQRHGMVSLDQALYLIRSTLLTLNDANRTGNYTVLRDLASPDFQAKNSAADLSEIFTDLRRRHFDQVVMAQGALR